MDKKIFFVFVFGMFAITSLQSGVYAEDMKEMDPMHSETGKNEGMAKRDKGMPPMMMMQTKMMMEKSVVATSDGGVVIVTGNKMTKYDKDLNVVKEVEMKMDMEAMEKNMKEMREKCSMMAKKDN